MNHPQRFQQGRPAQRPHSNGRVKEQDPLPYLDDAGQQTVDVIAQRAARDVIHALKLKDETATWQLVRKTLRAPLAVAYDEGMAAAQR